MPSALTHYIFNNQLIKDEKYKQIFLLAGQGADTLFFYGYNIVKRNNKKEIRQLGYDLHAINPDKLYMEMLKYAFSKSKEEKEILINFTRGFMYHYALDKELHPYVFYNTGFPYTNKSYNFNHGNFESILDTLLMKKYAYKNSTRSILKAKNKEIKICSKMVAYIVKQIFNIEYIDDTTYYKAYKDYRFARLLLDSKHGIKKAIFNKFFNKSLINVVSQPHKVKDDDKYDYLNTRHKEWVIPSTGEISNYSVDDLFLKAEEDTRIIDTIIYNFKDNIVTQKKITKFTDNTNHDGRNLDKNMTYFKVIWTK